MVHDANEELSPEEQDGDADLSPGAEDLIEISQILDWEAAIADEGNIIAVIR